MSSKSLTPEAAGVVLGTSITVVVPKSTVAGGPYDVGGLNVEGGPYTGLGASCTRAGRARRRPLGFQPEAG